MIGAVKEHSRLAKTTTFVIIVLALGKLVHGGFEVVSWFFGWLSDTN